jgi:hypothetical protein
MVQWTAVQAEVATMTYPKIGSICSLSEDGEPVVGRLSTAPAEGLPTAGPFSSAAEYFTSVGEAALGRLSLSVGDPKGDFISLPQLGTLAFLDIIKNTPLFEDDYHGMQFPLNHMDLGTQNTLVDVAFNFLAIIDWEFAQTAPWQVNHYPMPFPLLWSDQKINQCSRGPGPHCARKHITASRCSEVVCTEVPGRRREASKGRAGSRAITRQYLG